MSAVVVPSGECLRGESLVWLIGAVVCSLAAYRGSSCSFVSTCNGRPHLALQHHWLLPINCHFDDCKARLASFPCKTRYIRITGFCSLMSARCCCAERKSAMASAGRGQRGDLRFSTVPGASTSGRHSTSENVEGGRPAKVREPTRSVGGQRLPCAHCGRRLRLA